MNLNRGRRLGRGVGCLTVVLGAGVVQAQPVLTGDAEADFRAGSVVIPDPNGVDVGMPLQFPLGTVSGNDLKDIRFQYDAATDTMFVALNTYGIASDVDADGDASRTGAVLAGLGGTDFPRLAGTESFALLIDIDEDGVFDVTAGVEAGTNIDAFAVTHFSGNPLVPSFAFGVPLAGVDGVVFSDPEPGAPDIEFTISNWSTLPSSGADVSTGFRVNAFLGSLSDAGIGEDFVPGIGESVRICQPVPETCNAIDDDCDGQVDEGFNVGSMCRSGVGACAVQGLVLCQPNGEARCSATPRNPTTEACDGADNDCDGTTDEGIAGACTSNLPGLCSAGHLRCENAALRCEPNTAPAPERCDTQDNDCDGSSDENLPVGQICATGVGACRAAGIFVCDANGGIRCTGTPSDPRGESCDNIDNDCDGRADEDFNLGDACATGVGACRAEGEIECDGNGSISCSAQPGEPVAELCNGTDDDCDNSTDEGLGLGDRCGTGVGACRDEGEIVCAPGGSIACNAQPGVPGAETCNGADDDCDNSTDEGFGLGDACREGVGACADDGRVVCDGRGGATCDATPGRPGRETCNGTDDDCDGSVDEGFDLGSACREGVGVCADEGHIVCDGRGAATCDATPGNAGAETCNATDDDCDGRTDEDFDLGTRCGTGVGACRGEGEIVCDANGSIRCTAVPGEPVAELCNGADDDCDNSTDEGLGVGDRCGTGVGACRDEGEIVCAPGGSIVCNAQPGAPGAETCNGADDDCDNSTDEGFGLGDACNEGVGACADEGRIVCDGNGGATCDATPGNGGAETCNNTDDDCDGRTDEGVTRACGSDVGECQQGRSACVAGQFGACEGEVGPAAETCNGWDDDCDGRTDEGFDLGTACNDGVGACGARGVIVCNYAGGTMCNAQPGAPRAEGCDNIDNDCDGRTDEGVTRACGSDVGACEPGVSACVAGRFGACQGGVGPAPESCNGLDDNCDGTTDEGLGLGEPCGTGVGACRDEGEIVCAPNGSIVCNAQPGAPGAETCNGADDDCDNSTDEGFGLGDACNEGVGACADEGHIVCDGNGGATCDATPGNGGAETCNNTDDDCDGQTDEGVTEACGSDEGACQAGTRTCAAGRFGACEGAVGPAAETCNGTDDDCDASVDEGFDVGSACTVGEGTCQADGQRVCTPAGGTTCNAQPADPIAETCNGEDDDCDRQVDEGFELGGACVVGVGACQSEGMLVCDGGDLADQAGELIVNGSFENPVLPDAWEYYFDEGAWPGWVRTRGTGTELQQISGAFDGAQYAELDADSSSCIAQTVATRAGQQLTLSLAFSARTGVADNAIEVIWNGDVIAVLNDSGVGRNNTAWQVHTFAVEAVGPESVVEFCDASRNEPTLGGFIDAISLRGGDGVVCDAQPGQPGVETCNGIDDDCDGATDEDFALGEACREGAGACGADGVTVCGAGGDVVCNAQPRDPAWESCNGTDDDCDGTTDEGYNLGAACNEGRGACADAGVIVCDGQGGATCDAEAGQPVRERCNYADDDCDGRVDEEFGIGLPCRTGVGACAVVGVCECNDQEEVFCDANQPQPTPEVCDAIDNDCDGRTDEGLGLGDACTVGEGECARTGRQVCDAGAVGCDVEPGQPAGELCDGRDNDCDGATDEAGPETRYAADEYAQNGHAFWLPAFNGAGTHVNMHFEDDAELVLEGNGGHLTGTAFPVGQPDQRWTFDLELSLRGTGARFGGPKIELPADQVPAVTDLWVYYDLTAGVIRRGNEEVRLTQMPADGSFPFQMGFFANGKNRVFGASSWFFWTRFEGGREVRRGHGDVNVNLALLEACEEVCDPAVGAPRDEVCDGADNDCDGRADEGFGLGEACREGAGACAADGIIACDGRGGATCNAQPRDPARESCNGSDDDCDGHTDEGFGVGDACNEGQGACADAGVIVCDGQGGATCDAEAGQPVRERCNEVDDDCDGRVDEEFGIGLPCRTGVGACAVVGLCQCNDQEEVFCDANAPQPTPEVCDSIDNDCDGRTDEGFGLGEACTEGQGVCAAQGVTVCDGQGGASCDAEPSNPGAELCDDLDNDCDGETDEGFGLGDACHAGTGLCRRAGERVCDGNGGARCDATAGHPADELCDEEDNDCDGRIDEDFGLQDDCSVGLGACRRDGVTICGESDVVAGLGGTLLLNGSFEEPVLNVDWRVYQEIPGWTTVAGEGIEIQRIWGAGDGRQYVELDSHPEPGAGCMMQTVPTTAGAIYRLSFQHSARPNVGDNRMAFYWDGMEVAEVDANGIGRNATQWNRYAFDVAGNGDGGTLVICDVTGDADTLGGLVDDIRLEMVEGIICDAVPGEPTDERCDGIDNDCDGYTDEDLGLGQACGTGVGACAAEGVQQCDEHGNVICTAVAHDPEPEQCDDIDNDCDGETDEEGCDVECDGQARTQTPGGWGARAQGNNPAAYRNAHFAACFPNGLILGDQEGIDGDRCHALVLTTSAKVERFLPNGGGAAALTCDELNPASSRSGSLSNHLAAAMLSVGFDRCNPDFGRSDVGLGDFVVSDRQSPCYGWTVDQVITEGNLVISGCGGRLRPTDIAGCLALVNENFVDGVGNNGDLVCDGDDLPPVPPPPAHQQCD